MAGVAFDPLVHRNPDHPPRLYRFVVALLRLVVPRLFRFRVVGLEHVPRPPYLIASNHQAWYDTLFLLAAFPDRPMVYTMARRDTVFNRGWKRWLVPRFGVFPISPSRGELDQRGVATVYQVLARGGVVLVFPEGRYSRGRALRPLKKGVAHFALQAGVPICPVALSGLDRLRPFGVVEVSIGPPIRPDPPAWWTIQVRVEQLLDRVRRAILGAFDQDGRSRRTLRTRLGRAVGAPLRALRQVPGRLRRRLRRGTRNSEGDKR
ncbi:MAG TPA: lysophospholipid acyltransferase family protein [Terriglobales bacterium]|nr:lysophospholipid acyltransferase family protein [Terriglobales bacterium]